MSDEIRTYSFFPWLREGIANKVSAPADAAARRGQIAVTLKITGKDVGGAADHVEDVPRSIEVYGPGDVVGIDAAAIVKTEPRNWITDFEPNYLPYIDFYDEDFAWRYTPTAPVGGRLNPWITLVVLTEEEFDDGQNILNRPLNFFTLTDSADPALVFPKKDELWAWAHVQVNRDVIAPGDDPVSTDESAFIARFGSILRQNPDLAFSRVLSPRKLGESTAYHAFLIPSFEAGRMAGLGLDPTAAGFNANTIAWEQYGGRQELKSFPYYHRWFFRTSTVGDFEHLVRLLEPKVADSRVGHRDIDVQAPGSNIDGIDDPRLAGILRLGGALQVPVACLDEEQATEHRNYDEWYDSYPHDFQSDMSSFINLADDYTESSTATAHADSGLTIDDSDDDGDPDPLITPPLYGRWHALTPRLLSERDGAAVANNDNWVHDLNLDPRWRTAAGFGTNVVQEHQEEYMDAAWEQVGDVLEANRRLRWAHLAGFAAKVWFRNTIEPKVGIQPEKYLRLTAAMQTRVLSDGKTVAYSVSQSRVPQALISAPMRRITRPRGRMMRKLQFNSSVRPDNLVERVNSGAVDPAPPRDAAEDLLTHGDVADSVKPTGAPDALLDALSRNPWLQYLPLFIAIILIVLLLTLGLGGAALLAAAGATAVAGIVVFAWLRRLAAGLRSADTVLPDRQTPGAVDELPDSPDFRVTEFGDPFLPTAGSTDSPEAVRFKTALRRSFDFAQLSTAAGVVPEPPPLNVTRLIADVAVAINPAVTIPRYVFGSVSIPPRIIRELPEKFVEAMAYPVIDLPMYKPLTALSTEHFVPNVNLIEQNSITLLETNQRFIEAYMVGINHELSREFVWRGFPTDMRGTCCRQFWDVAAFLGTGETQSEEERDELYDIPPMHRWSLRSDLGEHDHPENGVDNKDEVVLAIRGDLLKKYPTAVIYAHRAKWATDEEGNRVLSEPRDLDDDGPVEETIKTPLYEAKVDPDIYFFGFDLDVVEAKGGSGENDDDEAGWFFVIKERPGEPRFGLDVPGETTDIAINNLGTWNDLAWSHVVADVEAGKFITLGGSRTISVTAPGAPPAGDNQEEEQQQLEDSHLQWKDGMNAAELAYILYQVPVLIGVHASEMLPDKCENTAE